MSQTKSKQSKTPKKSFHRTYRTRQCIKQQALYQQSKISQYSQYDESQTITNNSIFQQSNTNTNTNINTNNRSSSKLLRNTNKSTNKQSPPNPNPNPNTQKQTQYQLKDIIKIYQNHQKNITLQQQLDYQIQQYIQSYIRIPIQKIPNSVILTAKRCILQQITKLLSKSINRYVIIHNKSCKFDLCNLFKIIQRIDFDDQYKNKIVRSFILEEIQSSAKIKNIQS